MNLVSRFLAVFLAALLAWAPTSSESMRSSSGANAASVVGPGGVSGSVAINLARSYVAVSGAADTNENTLATITVPAGSMGANGQLRILTHWAFSGAGSARTIRVRFSGGAGALYVNAATNVARTSATATAWITNRNSAASQLGSSFVIDNSNITVGATSITSAADTNAGATTIVITCQKGTGADTCTLDGYSVDLSYMT